MGGITIISTTTIIIDGMMYSLFNIPKVLENTKDSYLGLL